MVRILLCFLSSYECDIYKDLAKYTFQSLVNLSENNNNI